MRYVFYLLLTSAIAGAMELEPEKQPTPPRNIYQAIDSDNHELIEYYAHHDQTSVHEYIADQDEQLYKKTHTCFCCFPFCCAVCSAFQTPLYYAIAQKKFIAAQILAANHAPLTS